MKRVLGWIAALIIALPVMAAGTTANLTWQHPTSRIDGSALPLSQIKETLIEWRRVGSSVLVGSIRVNAPATSTAVSGLICGDYDFVAYTVATDASQSDPTNTVQYATSVVCKPNPPTGFGAN